MPATADDLTTCLPPQSKPAEVAVIGAMVRDANVIPDILATLRADDFYFHAHQRLFRAVRRLADAKHPVDLVSVRESLVAD